MPTKNKNTPRLNDHRYFDFIDKRLVFFIFIVIVGLVLSTNLLLSVGKTSEMQNRLRLANKHLITTQDFLIQYDTAHAAINAFMFLGSDETWELATDEVRKLTRHATQLIEVDSARLNISQQLANDIQHKVNEYIQNLPPLRRIRQDDRGVIEGVVNSTQSQANHSYNVISAFSNAVEILQQEDDADKNLLIMLMAAQNRWLRMITEFRGLLLLRTSRAQQATLAQAEQFKQQWNEILHKKRVDILIQNQIDTVDTSQKAWFQSLPQVINIHMGKRWRRDLRYVDENLSPIGNQILSSLNAYERDIAEYIKSTTTEILALEKKNIIWVFIIMGLIIVFTLTMLLIYTRLLAAQQRKRIDVERINTVKTEFLSTISHELRTPLNAIIGFSQLLEMNLEGTLTEQQKININEITVAGNHLLHLVNEILDLSAIDSGNIKLDIQTVNLCDVLTEVISLSRTIAEKFKVNIDNQIPPSIDCTVQADPVRLRQIFLNLVSNAIKYNVKDGQVSISIEPNSDFYRVKIKDNGIGISKEDMEKLFQPFERLGQPSEIEGAGIGLMVTRELIEAMDGHIGVNSKPGKGTTFWVDLVASK